MLTNAGGKQRPSPVHTAAGEGQGAPSCTLMLGGEGDHERGCAHDLGTWLCPSPEGYRQSSPHLGSPVGPLRLRSPDLPSAGAAGPAFLWLFTVSTPDPSNASHTLVVSWTKRGQCCARRRASVSGLGTLPREPCSVSSRAALGAASWLSPRSVALPREPRLLWGLDERRRITTVRVDWVLTSQQ